MKKYELYHLKSMVVSDANLDSLVREITSLFPRSGEKTINGRLRSCSIQVPRQMIRDSLRRVDPSGIHERWRRVLHRRKYQVAALNALWHLDGFHLLCTWICFSKSTFYATESRIAEVFYAKSDNNIIRKLYYKHCWAGVCVWPLQFDVYLALPTCTTTNNIHKGVFRNNVLHSYSFRKFKEGF